MYDDFNKEMLDKYYDISYREIIMEVIKMFHDN